MIGWKVNAGAEFLTAGTLPPYTNINEINFLDFNVPATIVTNGMFENDYDPTPDIYTSLKNQIGSDVDYLFSIEISKTYPSSVTVPAMQLGFPNCSEYFKGKTTPSGKVKCAILHFISLNRLFIFGDGTSTSTVYSVSNDGSLSVIERGLNDSDITNWISYAFRNVNNGVKWIYKGDNTEDSILDYRNWGTCLINTQITNVTFPISSTGYLMKVIRALFSNNYTPPDWDIVENPYEPGGESGTGGGGGSFDDDSDIIGKPSLPTLSSSNTGFTRIYNPSLSQVQDLARYLWTEDSVIETIWNKIKQFFENPMDAIIGFNLVPVQVPNGGTENFKLLFIDTGVSMTVAANQFVDVDCGTLEMKPYYGSALDYSPYTKISCFLPFIGNVSLNVDEVMGRTLAVSYRVDICSGSCVAYIEVDGNAIYQYSGHCAISIPFSAADFTSYVNTAISVGKLAGAALTAGAGAAAAIGTADAVQQTNQVVTTTQITQTARNPTTGRQITTGTQTTVETREAPVDQSSTQASFSGVTPQNVSNTVGAIMSSKPHIEHSGSFSGNSGYLGVRRPFVIIERPNMCMPSNFQSLNGFPSMITLELGSCKGFTRVQQVQLKDTCATNPEQAEILELLKSGVIL